MLTWISIGALIAMFLKAFREFLSSAINFIVSYNVAVILLLFVIYLCCVVWGLNKIELWGFHLIKDTFYWFILTGLLILFNSIGKDLVYFKKIALNSIKLTIVLEFMINLHVFSYVAELITIPILLAMGIIIGFYEHKERDLRVGKVLDCIVILYGLSIMIFAIFKTVANYKQDLTFENLQGLFLPTILTVTFIPFFYFVSLYSAYENLFSKLNNLKNEDFSKSRIIWKIVMRNKLNLIRVNEMNLLLRPYDINISKDIDGYLKGLK